MIHISTNISKLGAIRAFSLPVSSCLFPSRHCIKYCYARKGRFQAPHVKKALSDNLNASMNKDFVEQIHKRLSFNERYFRIHPSGDFYSIDYYNRWVRIASLNPHIKFLAYTRNHTILYHPRPSNFILFWSLDESSIADLTPQQHHPLFDKTIRKAFVIDYRYTLMPHHSTVTPSNNQTAFLCNNQCAKGCLTCWNLEPHNIAFPQKYKSFTP